MSTRSRAVVGTSCALIGAAVLFSGIHVLHAKHAVRDYKARLAAQGEPFTVDELVPAPSAAARTAANSLVQAVSQLRPGNVVPDHALCGIGMVATGGAVVAWKQPVIRDGKKTNSWEVIDADLKVNAAVLDQIRDILSSPHFDMNLNYHAGFNLLLPHLVKSKVGAQWLSGATIADLHAGRFEAADANLAASLSLPNVLR